MRDRSDTLTVGDAAPAFELEDARGGTISLESLRGRRVAIYFFRGTW